MGGYERDPAPWSLDGIPPDFNGKLLAPDWPRFEEIMAGADPPRPGDRRRRRVSRIINGPEGVHARTTSSSSASREVRGFFVAAGFCAHGIAGAGGIGRQVASWIVDGEPELDLWKMDIRRFGAGTTGRSAYTLARSIEIYATYYDIHYPNEERQAGRPLRTSPTYDAAAGARRGRSARSPAGSGRTGSSRTRRPRSAGRLEALRPRGWAGEHWSPGDRRRGAGDADRPPACSTRRASPRSRSPGPGAARVPPADVRATTIDRPVGSIVYTQMLNRARRHRVRPDRHPARAPTASCS